MSQSADLEIANPNAKAENGTSTIETSQSPFDNYLSNITIRESSEISITRSSDYANP